MNKSEKTQRTQTKCEYKSEYECDFELRTIVIVELSNSMSWICKALEMHFKLFFLSFSLKFRNGTIAIEDISKKSHETMLTYVSNEFEDQKSQ